MEGTLALWIVIAGFAMMIGGKKAMAAVFRAPFQWSGRLLGDLIRGAVDLALDLIGGILRGVFRLLSRGVRRIFGLPPPRRPHRQNRRPHRDDEDNDD